MLNKAIEAFGGLHYACNAAGIEQGLELLADVAEDEWARIIATNLVSSKISSG